MGSRRRADETDVRVGGRWMSLSRAVDAAGRVVDVLLRPQRDLESARACFEQAIARRGVRPKVVLTDKHASSRRAVRRRTWRATHIRTGRHRAPGETTKAIERARVPSKDRLRPRRGLPSAAPGQRLLEGIELARAVRAVRRGHIRLDAGASAAPPPSRCPHLRARDAAATFTSLAKRSAQAASRHPRAVDLMVIPSLAHQHTSTSRPPRPCTR